MRMEVNDTVVCKDLLIIIFVVYFFFPVGIDLSKVFGALDVK